MSCCGEAPILSAQEQFGVLANTPCQFITVDLLQLYKDKVDCYLVYSLWDQIGSNQIELESARDYLAQFIAQKIIDPNNCAGIDSLYIVRVLVDKIVKKGACL